ncbi:MAG TPA: DUF2383 domain-containing protein [Thermoanaerobaculia bacterium]|jgi:demethoxyubiquinone hydroxylase (CLK1/Coq7/Cat5 family)|nr:DUF2383 domain-containing protein [Thermoanaerobaculia bacterium]
MATTTTTQKATLDSLLRGEMSAIETYRMAIEKLTDSKEPEAAELQRIQRDHRDAADVLWHRLESKGERPSEGSGAWGAFAKAVEGTAKLLGNKAALKALKEGEEHGLKEYEGALDDEGISPELQSVIRPLLSRQQSHIQTLDRLLATVK